MQQWITAHGTLSRSLNLNRSQNCGGCMQHHAIIEVDAVWAAVIGQTHINHTIRSPHQRLALYQYVIL